MPSFNFCTSATKKQSAGDLPAPRHVVIRISEFVSKKKWKIKNVVWVVKDSATTRHNFFDKYFSNIFRYGICLKFLTGTGCEFSSLVLEYHLCEGDFLRLEKIIKNCFAGMKSATAICLVQGQHTSISLAWGKFQVTLCLKLRPVVTSLQTGCKTVFTNTSLLGVAWTERTWNSVLLF